MIREWYFTTYIYNILPDFLQWNVIEHCLVVTSHSLTINRNYNKKKKLFIKVIKNIPGLCTIASRADVHLCS